MTRPPNKALPPAADPLSKGDVFDKPHKEVRDPRFAELDALIAAEGEAEMRDKAQRSTSSLKPKRKRRSPPLPREYRGVVIRTAMEHRKQFRALFAADPTIRDRGARLYRSLLFPQRRGKKPTRRVVLAVEFLKKLGRKPRSSDWNRVDLKCLSGLDRLSDLERRDLRRRFHHTVRTYLRRHRIKLE